MGSSFGRDYLAATILYFPPVANDDVFAVTIKVGLAVVEALAVLNNADGSLRISFRTSQLTTGAGMVTTVQLARADVPQLAVFVEFHYYDATKIQLIGVPSPRIASNHGGTESVLSFANYAVCCLRSKWRRTQRQFLASSV